MYGKKCSAKLITTILIIFAISLCGCGKAVPTAPGLIAGGPQRISSQSPNRTVFAYGTIAVSEDRTSVEMMPSRTGELHLNVVKLIEGKACNDCLEISDWWITESDLFNFMVTLKHPFNGYMQYTGFDVRTIIITGSDYTFPLFERSMSWSDNVRLLHPDGYTTLFNPTEYPVESPGPPALRYIPGNYEFGGDLSATLNPYIAFGTSSDQRCMFTIDNSETKMLSLQLTSGALEVGYAVDACWTLIDTPVIDPLTEFPPEANCREAYRIFMHQGLGLKPEAGSSAWFQVEALDHQGVDTVSAVMLEAPDLFDGIIEMPLSGYTDEGVVFQTDIFNDKGAGEGVYPMAVRIIDSDEDGDENLGLIDAWHVAEINVTDSGFPMVDLIHIPEGWFYMGVDPANDPDGVSVTNTPGHMHKTGEYWISRYEITHEVYGTFIAAGGYTNPEWWSAEGWEWKEYYGVEQPGVWQSYIDGETRRASWPIHVSFYEAEAFCRWAGGRLPTEPEWERAARGDNDHRVYPWGDEFNSQVVSWKDNPLISWGTMHMLPVGSFSPEGDSPWGLADCSGNASELTSTWATNMGEDYEQYESGDFTPPPPPSPGEEAWVIVRGGSRSSPMRLLRCADRWLFNINNSTGSSSGFRIVFD